MHSSAVNWQEEARHKGTGQGKDAEHTEVETMAQE